MTEWRESDSVSGCQKDFSVEVTHEIGFERWPRLILKGEERVFQAEEKADSKSGGHKTSTVASVIIFQSD